MKKMLSLFLTLILAFGMTLSVCAAEPSSVSGGVTEIQKYGNLVLDIAPDTLHAAGWEFGDLLNITVDGRAYQAPLCTNYSDVDTGSMVLRESKGTLILAINMGDFATGQGIATKVTAEDGSVSWEFPEGKSMADISVTLTMAEKGGYRNQYLLHQLKRTDDRTDYASDVVFANFRNISGGSIGKNVLFRSSSPANNELGRASYADTLAKAAGIQTVLNLADGQEAFESYIAADDFASPYYLSLYQNGSVKLLNLGIDFTTPDFQKGLADGLRFLTVSKGPYLVHCNEGKDRAGFVSALLSCLMGTDYNQVVNDYMISYENYYHLEAGSEQYEAVKNSNIVSILSTITGVSDPAKLKKADLSAAAEAYIRSIGLTNEEINTLKANLSQDCPEPAVITNSVQTYTVITGDCLSHISRKVYGTDTNWKAIWKENEEQIQDPNVIYCGQVLTIPAA